MEELYWNGRKKAADQGERDGFYCLGQAYLRQGSKSTDYAKKLLLQAAELGRVSAMDDLGGLFDESDPQRWFWWIRAAERGLTTGFTINFRTEVEKFRSVRDLCVLV